MTNFNFQGKIIRHFWGKLIRQSTYFIFEIVGYYKFKINTWGGSLLVD